MKNEKAQKPHKYSVGVTIPNSKNGSPKIYLSGPITGVENYKQDFKVVENELISNNYTNIINPAELDKVILNGGYEEYMQICLALIDMCDIVILLPGWQKSSGANREYGYAAAKEKVVVTYEDLVIESYRGKE